MGLVPGDGGNLRGKMENHFTGDLFSKGYTAISSLKEYGPGSFQKMTEEAVVNQLPSSGVDAVITIVLLDKKRERYYVPARVYYSPYAVYHNHFWGYALFPLWHAAQHVVSVRENDGYHPGA